MAGRSVINVLVNADPRKFTQGMHQAEGALGKFGNAAKNTAKIFAGATLAMGAAAGAFAVKAIQAGEAASTANARLEQIATSMGLFGDEAGAVAERLQGLAKEQAKLTGVNQNTIKESQALLLTFGNLAESADDAGGAFDRATQLTLDMAAAGFGGATDNAKQLGKALNDPIKGISALSRSGITFTEQQKDLIESLVESGDLLAAQDLILTEIETQVGGTAEATANASDRLKVAFSQVSETIGLMLLPYFEQLVDFLIDSVIPKFEAFAVTTVGQMETGAAKMRDAFALVRDRFGEVNVAASTMSDTIRDRVNVEFENAKTFAEEYSDELLIIAGAIGGMLTALAAYQTAMAGVRVVTLLATAAQVALNIAMSANPIGIIVLAIAALVGGLIVAYQRFEGVRNVVDKVWAAIKITAEVVWDFLKDAWAALVDAFNKFKPTIDRFVGFLRSAWGAVGDFVDTIKDLLGPLAGWFNDNVVSTFAAAFEFFKTLFQQLYDFIAPIIGFVIDIWLKMATTAADAIGTIIDIVVGFIDYVKPLFEIFWGAMSLIVQTAFEVIENTIEVALGIIRGIFETATALLKGDFEGVWEALKGIVETALGAIEDFVETTFGNIIDFIGGIPDKIGEAAKGMFSGIKNAFVESVNFIIRAWNSLEFKIPGFDPPGPGPKFNGFTLGVPDIPEIALASGGIVTRPTTALIGEAGPEAVIPLDKMGKMGATYVTVNVNAGVGDPTSIGAAVVDAISAYERSNGKAWRAA